MQKYYETTRLSLSPLTPDDAAFIQELVNSPEWIEFIGQRNVTDEDSAKAYIQKILDSPSVQYWVARLSADGTPVGVVTLIQRAYLEHQDLGFALLKRYTQQGLAKEAALAVLDAYWRETEAPCILATTVLHNSSSIQLLERLGYVFQKEIQPETEPLRLYVLARSD